MPKAPSRRSPSITWDGIFGVALDLLAVDVVAHEPLECVEEGARPRLLFGVGLGVRMDEIERQAPEEQLADERRRGPRGLARRLGDGARLELADLGFHRPRIAHSTLTL